MSSCLVLEHLRMSGMTEYLHQTFNINVMSITINFENNNKLRKSEFVTFSPTQPYIYVYIGEKICSKYKLLFLFLNFT